VNTPVLGWDKLGFYNPSFLMLTLHRMLANVSYAGFVVAGIAGVMLFLSKNDRRRAFHERGGRAAFLIAFIAFIGLPIVGYFYAMALKYYARGAYNSLMLGQGDVVAGGVDWWWVKHVIVVAMLAMALVYFRRDAKARKEVADAGGKPAGFSMPLSMIHSVAAIYLMYYVCMGQVMTWTFTWAMIGTAAGAWLLGSMLLRNQGGNARMLFIVVGLLSFFTVMFGGYVREAARPRFVNEALVADADDSRLAYYDAADKIFPPAEQQEFLLRKDLTPEQQQALVAASASRPAGAILAEPQAEEATAPDWINTRCIGCHSLATVREFDEPEHWARVVWRMKAYGARINEEQAGKIIEYLKSGGDY